MTSTDPVRAELLTRWPQPRSAGLAAALLELWGEPHRAYHTADHLLAVLDAIRRITRGLAPDAVRVDLVELAAWYHDAVYTIGPPQPGGTEPRSPAGAGPPPARPGRRPARRRQQHGLWSYGDAGWTELERSPPGRGGSGGGEGGAERDRGGEGGGTGGG